MAYQIAFDLYESATQQFLSRVLATIKKTAPALPTAPEPAAAAPEAAATEGEAADKMDTDDKVAEGTAVVAKVEAAKPQLSKEEAELNDKVLLFTFLKVIVI